MRVQLGNTAPHEVLHRDEVKRRGLKATDYPAHDKNHVRVPVDVTDAVTDVTVPDDRSIRDAFLEVTHLWDYHSSAAPSWVASDSQGLASLLAENYGCDVADLKVEAV